MKRKKWEENALVNYRNEVIDLAEGPRWSAEFKSLRSLNNINKSTRTIMIPTTTCDLLFD